MEPISISYAKAHLHELLDRVSRGEEVLIARRGQLAAKLVGVRSVKRKPGSLKGRIRIAPDFDAPLPPAAVAAFEGEPD